MRILVIIILCAIVSSCKAQSSSSFFIEKIERDSCLEFYYRLNLKNLKNDSIYKLISRRDYDGIVNIHVGDSITISLRKISLSDVDPKDRMRDKYFNYYCNGKLILKVDESFYISENIKGLTYIK